MTRLSRTGRVDRANSEDPKERVLTRAMVGVSELAFIYRDDGPPKAPLFVAPVHLYGKSFGPGNKTNPRSLSKRSRAGPFHRLPKSHGPCLGGLFSKILIFT